MKTLNLMPAAKLYSMIVSCLYDSRTNASDNDVYDALSAKVKESTSGGIGAFFSLVANIRQLADQRAELTRETVSIMAHLGTVVAV